MAATTSKRSHWRLYFGSQPTIGRARLKRLEGVLDLPPAGTFKEALIVSLSS
jgi:hypothetical protein